MNKEAIELIMKHLKNTDETFDLLRNIIKHLESRVDYLESSLVTILKLSEKETK